MELFITTWGRPSMQKKHVTVDLMDGTHGYRLMGIQPFGPEAQTYKHTLSERDVRELRALLNG